MARSPDPQPAPAPPPVDRPDPSVSTVNVTADGSQSTGLHVPAALRAEIGEVPDVPGYEVLEVLAHGGMGYVLKARDIDLRRLVAVKLPLSNRQSPADRDRFLREAQAAAGLRHPNICQIHRVGTAADGIPFIAMEFLAGRTLRDVLKDQPPTVRAAAELLATLAGAVAYAHGHSIVHRDLKPANVMVLADGGQPVLTDFGLAKDLGETDAQLTQTGQVMGTPAFMSPEQAAGRTEEVGPATDVYALGGILYQMLTGQPPFTGPSGEVMRKVQTDDPVPPRRQAPKVHRDLETICLKCLAKRPSDRYPSASALQNDLERFAAGEPITARRAGVLRKAVVRARRNRAVVVVTGLLLVTAVAAGGYALSVRGEQERNRGRVRVIEEADRLEQQVASALAEASPWDEDRARQLEATIESLTRLSPEKGEGARRELIRRIYQEGVERLQKPTPDATDLNYVDRLVGLLRTRDQSQADGLAVARRKRERDWQTTFRIDSTTGGGLFDTSGGGPKHFADDRIDLLQPHIVDNLPVHRLTVSSRGHIRLRARFAPGWDKAGDLGLVLHAPAKDRGGYEIVLRPALLAGVRPEARTFATARELGAAVTVQLIRNRVVLREDAVPAVGLGAGALDLTLQRVGDRVTAQVNQLAPIEYRDLFPLPGSGVYALVASSHTPLLHAQAESQLLPAAPSPLERGDELLMAGDHLGALTFYQQQAIAAAGTPAEAEARFKEGVALLKLDRRQEAADRFARLHEAENKEWGPLAGCYLLAIRVREKDMEQANQLLHQLALAASQGKVQELAARLPEDVRGEILAGYRQAAGSFGLLRTDPDRVGHMERVMAVEEVLRINRDYRGWTRLQYVRALRVESDPAARAQALEHLHRWLDTDYPPGDLSTVMGVVLVPEVAWLLREAGKADEAVAHLNRWLYSAPGEYRKDALQLLPERARAHVAAGRHEQAEKDLEDYVRLAPIGGAHYRHRSDASLMLGLLREKRGEAAGAKAAWVAGKYPGSFGDPNLMQDTAGTIGLVNAVALALLTDSLRDEDVEAMTKAMLKAQPGGAAALLVLGKAEFKQVGQVLREGFGHPAARPQLWQFAFQTAPFREYYRQPILFAAGSLARTTAFAGQTTADQEKLLEGLLAEAFAAFSDGRLASGDMLSLLLSLKGSKSLSGWAGLEKKLAPAVRGPLCYVFGQRYLRLGKPADAAGFFRTAAADAPADSLLKKLAGEELAKLDGKK